MKYNEIGVIANTQGLKGHLKIKSFTSFADERYKKGSKLHILYENKYIEVIVSAHRTYKNLDIVLFEGLNDINLVEKYKGSTLYVSTEYVHELEDDEYYYTDLVDMKVYENSVYIGIVKEVRDYPQGEMLIIKRDKKQDALVPFRSNFVDKVDLKNKSITLFYKEGLL